MSNTMESSSAASPEPDSSSRRRSGRVVRPPSKYAPEPASSAPSKRKRGDQDGDEDDEDEAELDHDMSDAPTEGESDDEHQEPKPRKSSQTSRPKKPSIKKPKINGAQPVLSGAMARIPSRPKKTVRIDPGEKGTGLFADIFGSGDSSQFVAKQWLDKYKADNAAALGDLVNCILQCAGCDLEVTLDDVRDPENIPNRLLDLQSVYQEQQIVDYPLIARTRGTRSFRDLLVAFFQTLILMLHETDVMYTEPELVDNLHSWLASMSSSPLRPFRHTATTISLAVQSGLVDVASTLDRRVTNIESQLQAAKKGKNKNKVDEIQKNLKDANEHRASCSELIQSFFDTVFVHRYRDIDPKIRVECVEALGSWIWDLPTVFMEPGYLRYLGWMLSDTNAGTRQEVLKQLLKVFKRDAQQLGHFIDRFRPRLIEMATLDSEVSVRVTAIGVIDALRAAALLEPNEIDAIGKLIFDNEIRIRKAVVGFFVACIDDVLEGKTEEIGGSDVLDEFDTVEEDDYETPRKEWLNIKGLAETLTIYDAQIQEDHQNEASLSLDIAVDLLEGAMPETRISLASHVLYDRIPEIKSWEILAGYLLFDHTTSTKAKSKSRKSDSTEDAFKRAVAPTPEEETILLDVLSSAVKANLLQVAEHDRGKRRGPRSEAAEEQEQIALELATNIPRLLNKFGAEPETAAIVLRLEHHLNLDVFQQLRQDSSKYEKLLNEICTQFNRHDDKRVLTEATTALLHARQYEELEELTDSKLATLWETVVGSLGNFEKTCELSIRGNLELAPLKELSTVLVKMSKLASISDCVDTLEASPASVNSGSSAIKILVSIVHRGKYEPQDDEIDELEEEVVSLAIKVCQFYFMWKTRALSKLLSSGAGIPDEELNTLSVLRQTYRRYLIETFSSRAAIDQIRLFATGSLCDLHLTFATLRSSINNFRTSSSSNGESSRTEKFKVLVQEIESGLVSELITVFDGAEKMYAKKAKKDKTLNEPAEDEDPVDDEEESDEESDDEELSKEERFAAELRAEKALCELTAKYVLAISAKLIDNRGDSMNKLRRRIQRNQTKLGNNFKEVVAYLDEEKFAKREKRPAKPAQPAKPQKPALSAQTVTVDDDIDDDDIFEDEPEPEEGTVEDLRRRELLEDPIEDGEEDEDEINAEKPTTNDDDDSVLGD